MATFGAACFLATYGLIRGNGDGWGSPLIAGSPVAAAVLLVAFVAVERRGEAPMRRFRSFRIPPSPARRSSPSRSRSPSTPLLLFMDWTALLPGLLVGGVAIGVISPALAAAMISVLPVERSGWWSPPRCPCRPPSSPGLCSDRKRSDPAVVSEPVSREAWSA